MTMDLIKETTSMNVFPAESFWTCFQDDLRNARAKLLIQSPFIDSRHLEQLRSILKTLIERNVRVCLFVQQPPEWHLPSLQLTGNEWPPKEGIHQILATLETDGVHINWRTEVHKTVAVIDNSLLWRGECLSYDRASEQMRRVRSPQEAVSDVLQHKLDQCAGCASLCTNAGLEDPIACLRRLRRARRLSQKHLADLCGLHQSNIARLEAGRQDTHLSTLERIAEKLDCQIVLIPKWLGSTIAGLIDAIESTSNDL